MSSNPSSATCQMKIEEVKSTTKTQRIASHSHVKGLGLDEAAWPSRRRCDPWARGVYNLMERSSRYKSMKTR
uniref:RuvB-like helicase n=1 Tax=Ornithorhynchus anatinus TaxID=9258 RepID=A0A6I8P7L7_ORNAN